MESAATSSGPGPDSGPQPDTGPEPLRRQARFLREADQLKGVLRQSSILDGSRKENSAEHSWHLALMALVLRDYAPPTASSPLPPGQGPGLRALWDEFEERTTPEARFARALDRLQPMLANYYLGGGTWQSTASGPPRCWTRWR
jgi:putative hydrolase of HD superfamily